MHGTSKPSRPWAALVVATLAGIIFLVLLEGASSLVLSVYNVSRPVATYQQYHETFGWVGRQNTAFPDYFGPGKFLNINAQGFREDEETTELPPEGKFRAICSGDSFTFGQGVANDETWCYQLKNYLPGLDTVNLGQSGYGTDQSYLWYMHAGQHLQHRFHIFAFIGADLDRMSVTSNWDTGKPILQLVDGRIEVANTPVPDLRYRLKRIIRKADLRMVELGEKILLRLLGSEASREATQNNGNTKQVARKIFEDIAASDSAQQRLTLFVYLPTEQDIEKDLEWRSWARSTMDELNYQFVDLTPSMRQLPASQVASFFISGGDDGGHYTEAGNRWVAQRLSTELATRM
jgi:hypothetical protein